MFPGTERVPSRTQTRWPPGDLRILDFTVRPFRTVYMEYLMKALPAVATKVSSNPDAYVYLAESIRAWPDHSNSANSSATPAFGRPLAELTGGITAVHSAVR